MGDFRDLQADSYAMEECIKTARLYARSESPVTIVGEGGTEYSLIAACIHNAAMDISSRLYLSAAARFQRKNRKALFLVQGGLGPRQIKALFIWKMRKVWEEKVNMHCTA